MPAKDTDKRKDLDNKSILIRSWHKDPSSKIQPKHKVVMQHSPQLILYFSDANSQKKLQILKLQSTIDMHGLRTVAQIVIQTCEIMTWRNVYFATVTL